MIYKNKLGTNEIGFLEALGRNVIKEGSGNKRGWPLL